MSNRSKKRQNREAAERFEEKERQKSEEYRAREAEQERERAEREAAAKERGEEPPRAPSPVRLVETGGVTAAALWRLCRQRVCVVAPNIMPKNDKGRRLMEARLLCKGYALARAWDWNGGEELLCIAPGRGQDEDRALRNQGMRFVTQALSEEGVRVDGPRFMPKTEEGRRQLEESMSLVGGILAAAGEADPPDDDLDLKVARLLAPEYCDLDMQFVNRDFCDLGEMLGPHLFSFVISWPADPAKPDEGPHSSRCSYEYDWDSLTTPWSYEFHDMPCFVGEREGEFFLGWLERIETGLRRLEDHSEEEQAAIRAAAKVRPRSKSDWEYPDSW